MNSKKQREETIQEATCHQPLASPCMYVCMYVYLHTHMHSHTHINETHTHTHRIAVYQEGSGTLFFLPEYDVGPSSLIMILSLWCSLLSHLQK